MKLTIGVCDSRATASTACQRASCLEAIKSSDVFNPLLQLPRNREIIEQESAPFQFARDSSSVANAKLGIGDTRSTSCPADLRFRIVRRRAEAYKSTFSSSLFVGGLPGLKTAKLGERV